MGNSGSKDGINKQTLRLHAAIAEWNVEDVLSSIKAGAQVNLHRVMPPEESFAVWDAGHKPAAHETYGINALGKVLSEIHLQLEAVDRGSTAVLPFGSKSAAAMIKALLDGGADVNEVIEKYGVGVMDKGITTVVDAFRKILESSRNRDIKQKRGALLGPAFMAIIQSGKLTKFYVDDMMAWLNASQAEVVKAIIAGNVIFRSHNSKPERPVPALVAAIDLGNLPAAKTLLEYGCNANDADADGISALMHCTGQWDTRGSDDDDGEIRRPTVALVEALLQHGADVNHVDARGRNALHHFSITRAPLLESGARRFVCLRLLRAGLSITSKDSAGWTVLDCARDRKDTLLVKALNTETSWLRRRDAILHWSARSDLRK